VSTTTDLTGDHLHDLAAAVDAFVASYRAVAPDDAVSDAWTASDVLRHVAHWHDDYALNLEAELAGSSHVVPNVPYYRLNQAGVESLRSHPDGEVLEMLANAQARLAASIGTGRIHHVTYRAGSPPYTLDKFLQVVVSHIQGHAKVLRRIAARNARSHPGGAAGVR
jgi:hypothetical protein